MIELLTRMFWDPIFVLLTGDWPIDDNVERMRCRESGIGHSMCGFCWYHMLPNFMCSGDHILFPDGPMTSPKITAAENTSALKGMQWVEEGTAAVISEEVTWTP